MNEYIIKEGDNLTKIANLYGTTVLDIVNLNNIPNSNFIRIGDKIKMPKVDRHVPLIKNFNEIKQLEKDINSQSNIDIINYYHKNKKDNQIYLVDDKLNDRLSVYKNGVLLKSYRAIHGKNRELDDMTITHLDSSGNLINLAGNLSTPAGIFFTTKGGTYHGAPSFIRRTKELVASNNPNGIPSSIHARAIVEGANTNGCTGMSVLDLKDLSKYITRPNVRTYILPANLLNKFFIRNGELQFKSHDILRTPSYNTLVNKPIKYITYNTNNLTDTNKNIIKLFSQGLIDAKKSLLKDLGINNDTYNELALSALGILGVESGYGNENTAIGNLLRAARKSIFSNNSSPDYKSKYFTYGINKDNNSVGLTQIRFSFLSDREKELFKKYNITKDSLVTDPKKAAIATMIKLGQSYLDRGSVDKAISAWNNKPSYLLLVTKNKLRFNLFEMYRLGGILKNLNGNSFKILDINKFLPNLWMKNYCIIGRSGTKLPIGNQDQYNNVISIFTSLISKGVPPQAALEITNLKVAEKGWAGFTTGDNKKYSNADAFTDHIIDWHGRMYPDSLKANNFEEYWKSIYITPKYKYNENPNYKLDLLKTRPGVLKRINYYRLLSKLPLLTYINNINNNIV